jgi:hypothetical protein
MRGFPFNPAFGSARLVRPGASFVFGDPAANQAAKLLGDGPLVLSADALEILSEVARQTD